MDEVTIKQICDSTQIAIIEDNPHFGEEWVCNCSSIEEGLADLKRIKGNSLMEKSTKKYKLVLTSRKSWE